MEPAARAGAIPREFEAPPHAASSTVKSRQAADHRMRGTFGSHLRRPLPE
jgi:hypothetical protein